MISYELAKQLEKAGFPQKSVQPKDCLEGDFDCESCGSHFVYNPTLSELIEEMPMRQKHLGTLNDAHFVLRKLVSVTPMYWAYYEDEDTDEALEKYSFRCSTPEEAVANLYLAINKK